LRVIYRTVLRIRRFLDLEVTRLRRVPEAIALLAAALVVVGVMRATAAGADWAGILRGQAVNLISAAILAAFAYLLFILRFRRRQLSTYLERQRAGASLIPHHDPELSALARTIVDELLDAKPPHAALIIGPADAGQEQLLSEVAERMTKKRRVPVAVSLPSVSGDVTLPALVRDRFVEGLVGSSGDAQSGRRLYAALVRRRRVVALIRGLDRVGQGEPLATRRAAIARLLEGSLVEGNPFVAWIHPDLAPSISEVAAFRTRPLPRSGLVAYTMRQLKQRGLRDLNDIERALSRAFDESETTRDPVLLSLVADLVLRRVRAGERGEVAAASLFSDRCAFRRHFAWMCEWALGCTIHDLENAWTPPSLALAAIGREAHYRQEAELRSDDAVAALDADERRRFAAGVALLSHRSVLDVTHIDGSSRLRFTHPAWLAFAGALGLRLNAAYWRDLLRPDASSATLEALTGALLIFGLDVLRERSFLGVLRSLGLPQQAEISLEMALSVITALQSSTESMHLGKAEMETLERAWTTAGDVAKTRFVSDVNLEMNPLLMDFLWRRVVPPGFGENSFRVRRAICSRLGSLGSSAWQRLGPDWRKLVEAASAGDLSSRARQSEHWRNYGYGVASLGWTLPGVLRTVEAKDEEDAFALLPALRKLVERSPQGKSEGERGPEIGLEISLAEGFKVAAVEISTRREACDERWCAESASFLESSRSWISKQALLQALALVLADATGDRLERLVGRGGPAEREHPFVRETAALVRRTLAAGKEPVSLIERDIWLEDVEALDDGGVDLSPECHRLLGLSTLLINLAEWPFIAWISNKPGAAESSVDARDRAFTGIELPKCFLRRGHAATMFETECDCSFKFCGRNAKKGVLGEARRFSRSFLQRAQATARARSLIRSSGGNGFAEKAFAPVWRTLDDELEKEPYLMHGTEIEKRLEDRK
jgi:hypothetical protein